MFTLCSHAATLPIMDEWDDKKHLEFDIEMALKKSPHRVKRQQPETVLRIMAKAIVTKLSKRWSFKRKPPAEPH